MTRDVPRPSDRWSNGEAYDAYIGRWSRVVAREFIAWLAVPSERAWLDVGSGTGALTETVLAQSNPSSVKGIDPSEDYITQARTTVADPRARFEVGDAEALNDGDGAFDAAVSGLVLNFVPHPERAVREMARVVRPGGWVAAYVWDYGGKMEQLRYFWDAVAALHPAAAGLDEGTRFPLCTEAGLAACFSAAGLKDAETRAIDARAEFRDFDDYWAPFLGGQGPAAGFVAGLPASEQEALRERLRASLPVESDGSIRLIARAWAVRGKP